MCIRDSYDERMPGNNTLDEGAGLTLGFMDSSGVRNFHKSIYPYLNNLQVYVCPSAVPYSKLGSNPAYIEVTATGGGNTSYAPNSIIADRNISVIPDTAGTVMMHEFRLYQRASQMRPYVGGIGYVQFQHGNLDNMHFDGANRLFCDGHAKWSKKTLMKFSDYGATGNGSDGSTPADTYFADSGSAVTTQQNLSFAAAF